jgi:cytochrome c5
VAVFLVCRFLIAGEDTAAKNAEPSSKEAQAALKRNQTKPKKQLTGAELYAIHCNRCHPERYAPERNADQWKTILLHMRTRANLPAQQAQIILKYLQEDSGK